MQNTSAMELYNAQNNGSSFFRAEELHNEQHQIRVGHNINTVEHLYLGDDLMPAYLKAAIKAQLKKAGVTYSELQKGAGLTDKEIEALKDPTSNPRLSTLEKAGIFFGIPVAALLECRRDENEAMLSVNTIQGDVINIKSIEGGAIFNKDSKKKYKLFDVNSFLYCPYCEYSGNPLAKKKGAETVLVCPHCERPMVEHSKER